MTSEPELCDECGGTGEDEHGEICSSCDGFGTSPESVTDEGPDEDPEEEEDDEVDVA